VIEEWFIVIEETRNAWLFDDSDIDESVIHLVCVLNHLIADNKWHCIYLLTATRTVYMYSNEMEKYY
jgi:hypothetical protein